jgi:hypothetical protein
MAKIVLTNAYVLLNGLYDISDYVSSVSLSTTHDLIETTQMNDVYKTVIAGLGQNQVSFEFYQNYADNGLEEIINGTSLGNSNVGTAIPIEIRPIDTVASASNPRYTFNAVISEWQPVNGAVGQLATVGVTWPISGPINKFITP